MHIGYLPLVDVETIILVKALVSASVYRGTDLTFLMLYFLEVMSSNAGWHYPRYIDKGPLSIFLILATIIYIYRMCLAEVGGAYIKYMREFIKNGSSMFSKLKDINGGTA